MSRRPFPQHLQISLGKPTVDGRNPVDTPPHPLGSKYQGPSEGGITLNLSPVFPEKTSGQKVFQDIQQQLTIYD